MMRGYDRPRMASLVLVAHSQRLLDALTEMVAHTVAGKPRCFTAGGTDDGRMGTSLRRVVEACRAGLADGRGDVLVLYDVGSAWLTIELALDELRRVERDRVHVSHAPLVEGALAAMAVGARGGGLPEMAAAARRAIVTDKQPGQVGLSLEEAG
jgi:PTS hybrid protein